MTRRRTVVRNFHWFSVVFSFLSLLAYSQKASCQHWCKNDGKVISIVLVHAVKCNLRSQRDWVQYLLSSLSLFDKALLWHRGGSNSIP